MESSGITQIDWAALLAVLDRVQRVLPRAGTVTIAVDHYWWIPAALRYDVTRYPTEDEAAIGQLLEDFEWLARLASDEQRQLIAADLIYLGKILQAIGEKCELSPEAPVR